MAVSVEVSELVERSQWLTEEQFKHFLPTQPQAVIDEMSDVQIYLLRLATKLNVNLVDAAEQKIVKNEAKYLAYKVKGSSKKYNQYDSGSEIEER